MWASLEIRGEAQDCVSTHNGTGDTLISSSLSAAHFPDLTSNPAHSMRFVSILT